MRLVSFAVHWIKAEIHEYIIRNWRLVKVATTKAQRKLFFNLRSMRPDGQTLDPEQVDHIAQVNVRREDVSEMEVRMSGRDMSLETRTMTMTATRPSPICPTKAARSRPECWNAPRATTCRAPV